MLFTNSFFGVDEFVLAPPPTDINNINNITLTNVELHTLWGSHDTDITLSTNIPKIWNFDTIIYNCYDTTTIAGNVDWAIEQVSHILVKQREKNLDTNAYCLSINDRDLLDEENDWVTIASYEVENKNDLNISGVDLTPGTGKYQYALVPIINGNEGEFGTNQEYIEVTVDRLVICDQNETWYTNITDGNLTATNTTPGSFIQTLNSKYPTYVSNSIANYQTISVTGEWYPIDNSDGCCNTDNMLDDYLRSKYINNFVRFLTNRKAKVLKSIDGRRWLVMVDDGVSNSMSDYFRYRQITFNCVEIGDMHSSEDLAAADILNIDAEFYL